jgi:hypothetical protein
MLHEQFVAQVQLGSQLQLQFSQEQDVADGTLGGMGFVMG